MLFYVFYLESTYVVLSVLRFEALDAFDMNLEDISFLQNRRAEPICLKTASYRVK